MNAAVRQNLFGGGSSSLRNGLRFIRSWLSKAIALDMYSDQINGNIKSTQKPNPTIGRRKGRIDVSVADTARQFYESTLRTWLEVEHPDEFVAIEPESGEYFVAGEFVDASLAAKRAYPDRKSFVIRIGQEAALHIGAASS